MSPRSYEIVWNTRPRERVILVACVLITLAAFFVIVTRSGGDGIGALRQEEGSLRAPASDALFTDGFGTPGAPPPVDVSTPGGDATSGDDEPSGDNEPGKDPSTPPAPGAPVVPPDDPDDGGLLGFLPDLAILPPLPPPPGRPNWLPVRGVFR